MVVDWLVDPIINGLTPFNMPATQTIDLASEMDADYCARRRGNYRTGRAAGPLERSRKGVRVVDFDRLLVAISGINRLDILEVSASR